MKAIRAKHDLSWIYVYVIIIFLLSPLLALVLLSLSKIAYLKFPPALFSLKWYDELIHNKKLLKSLVVSIRVAIPATMLATFGGTLAAIGNQAFGRRFSSFSRFIFLAPLIVPYVILAAGMSRLFILIGTRGINAIILAHATVALPYVFLMVDSGLHLLPKSVEEAARVLGAGRLKVLGKVTLPLLKPHIFAGMMFAFIASFGEFIIAYMLSGPRSILLTVYIYTSIREKTEPSITALLSLLTVSVLFLGFFYSRYYIRKRS